MTEPPGIYARDSEYLEHVVQLGYASGKLLSVSFPAEADSDAEPEHQLLERIFAYLENKQDDFRDVEVALTMATDRRAVLEALRGVPYGESVSVERLARLAPDLHPDEDQDLHLVREALAENPAPLIVPDHRVRDGPSGAPPDVEQKLRALEGL